MYSETGKVEWVKADTYGVCWAQMITIDNYHQCLKFDCEQYMFPALIKAFLLNANIIAQIDTCEVPDDCKQLLSVRLIQ